MIYVRSTYIEPITGKIVTRELGDDRPTCDTPRCTCVASWQYEGAQFLCSVCADDYGVDDGLLPISCITIPSLEGARTSGWQL